jgi:hypothetical protein
MPVQQPDCLLRSFTALCCCYQGWTERCDGTDKEPLPEGELQVENNPNGHPEAVSALYLQRFPADSDRVRSDRLGLTNFGVALLKRAAKLDEQASSRAELLRQFSLVQFSQVCFHLGMAQACWSFKCSVLFSSY